MPVAYVIGGYIPNGGTHMAYRLGQIAHASFGMNVAIVSIGAERGPSDRFVYEPAFPVVSLDQMISLITPDDFLICNPSFSGLKLGARVRARKLMYVQDFLTFRQIDPLFNCYVAVSAFVRDFLQDVHDIRAPVIPPYIEEHIAASPLPPLEQRKGVLLYPKPGGLSLAGADIAAACPSGVVETWTDGTHQDLLAAMRRASIFVYESLPEGFGLPALEAMAQGALVISTDTRGGRDYLESGENAFVFKTARLADSIPLIRDILNDPYGTRAMREAALATAVRFSRDAFDARWRSIMAQVIDGSWRQPDA